MTDYLIRTGKDGMVTDLLELDEENESHLSDKCYDCEQLEAVMVAFMKDFREKLAALEKRIGDLEKPKISWEDLCTKSVLDGPYSATENTVTLPNGTQFSWTY